MVTAVRSRNVDRPVLVLVPDLQGVECPQEGVAVSRLDPMHVLVHDLHRRLEVVAIQLAAICCLGVGHEIVDHRAAVDPDLAEKIRATGFALLGTTPLVRIGKAPKILMCYRAAAPFSKIETPELVLPDGSKAQVEILAEGPQHTAHYSALNSKLKSRYFSCISIEEATTQKPTSANIEKCAVCAVVLGGCGA